MLKGSGVEAVYVFADTKIFEKNFFENYRDSVPFRGQCLIGMYYFKTVHMNFICIKLGGS